MLMRFAKVTAAGEYVPPPPANAKASYSAMVYVRATIVEDAGEYLSRAVTIAVRCTPAHARSRLHLLAGLPQAVADHVELANVDVAGHACPVAAMP
jgi:hypothetical protein